MDDRHLPTRSSTSRSGWARHSVTIAAALALGAGALAFASPTPLAGAVTSSGERATYFPTTPCRLTDTRPDPDLNVGPRSAPIGSGETLTISARGPQGQCTAAQLPTDATALALNVTTLGSTADSFLTIWPGGTRPNASSLNPQPGQPPIPNAVTTPVDAAGRFQVFNNVGSVHVIVDVVGHYTDHDHDDRYYTESEIDTNFWNRTQADFRYASQGELDSTRTNLATRIDALETGGSSEGRTTFVGGDGASGTIGIDLEQAITAATAQSPTADQPWIIRLDAGTYTTGELTLPAHVHLRGSGPGVSIIGGRINATGDTSISDLTISNPGVNTFRSITTSSELLVDRVEVLGNSGLAVGSGADVTVTNSDFVIQNGPVVTTTATPATADVTIASSRLSNTSTTEPAMSVDGGSLTLQDVSGTFGFTPLRADDVVIDRSDLVGNGQFEVTNAGTMTVSNSRLERDPAVSGVNASRVVSVVGLGSDLTVTNSGVFGGGGNGDDVVGGATEFCAGIAHDGGFATTTCP